MGVAQQLPPVERELVILALVEPYAVGAVALDRLDVHARPLLPEVDPIPLVGRAPDVEAHHPHGTDHEYLLANQVCILAARRPSRAPVPTREKTRQGGYITRRELSFG